MSGGVGPPYKSTTWGLRGSEAKKRSRSESDTRRVGEFISLPLSLSLPSTLAFHSLSLSLIFVSIFLTFSLSLFLAWPLYVSLSLSSSIFMQV